MSEWTAGRGAELSTILSAIEHANLHSITLIGAAGVGKTWILRSMLDRAAELGRPRFWVAASVSAGSIPFGAVSHLMPDIAGLDRFQLIRRTAAWMRTHPGTGLPVIGVDDAHRLDDASAALIHHLAVTGAAFIAASVRANEDAPDAITALWKDGDGDRLAVAPFTRPQTATVTSALLGGPLDPVAEARIWHLSGGNALYLRELIRGGVESGDLRQAGGVWRWIGRITTAPRLNDLMKERLTSATADRRQLLDLVAFGEPLDMATLQRAGILASTVASAEETGLIASEVSNLGVQLRLGHPLYGEVVRGLTTSLRREKISRVLLQHGAAAVLPQDILRRAVWQLTGNVMEDPRTLAAGASRAVAALDLDLARRLANAAVTAGGGLPAETVLANTLVLLGRADEAETLLITIVRQDMPDLVRAEVTAMRAWNLVFGLHRPADGKRVLDQAADSLSAGLDLIAAQHAAILTYAGLPAQALAVAGVILDTADRPSSTVVKKWVVQAEALSVCGQFPTAVAHGRRAVELNRSTSHGDWSMTEDEAESALAGSLMLDGGLDEAEQLIETAYTRAIEAGWHVGAAMWSVWRGELCMARGLPNSAADHYRMALAVSDSNPHPYLDWLTRFAWDHLSRSAGVCHNPTLADAALEAANRFAWPWLGALDVWGGSTAGWVAVAKGQFEHGISLSLAAAKRARRDHQSGWELLALHQAVRFGDRSRAYRRLRELGGTVDGLLADLMIGHGIALASHDGNRLDAIAGRFNDSGYVLLAAETAAQSAQAHRRVGQARLAATATRCASDWASFCEDAKTPALALLDEPQLLTRREHEIARLVATGLTNRQVAEHLVISVRTVDNIVHHVYQKLSISRRQELHEVFNQE